MIGKTISHYKILEKLGAGGMGVVYKAQDVNLKRTVALKFLPPFFSYDEQAKKRFIHEARTASALDHPNICTIHESGETEEGQLFISMSYYEGETLKNRIAKGALLLHEAIEIALQIAEGLLKAHSNNIIHRDIKPANIFITNDGIVKILDFGLAKIRGMTVLTEIGTTAGTIEYMSPEQARGENVDQRSDIWSLGAVIYEMITGCAPFSGHYDQALIYSLLNNEPDFTHIPDRLKPILKKALSKNLKERYQDLDEFINELTNTGKSKSKGIISPFRLNKFKLRTKLAAIAFIAGTATVLIFNNNTTDNPPVSVEEKKMIVILPFKNLGSPEDEYLSQGMREEISNRLASFSNLGVISRNSAEICVKYNKTTKDIGKELGVDYILEGTLQWIRGSEKASRVRIFSQLIHVPNDINVWSDSYDREVDDIFNVQTEIAQNVVDRIGVNLFSKKISGPPPTNNLDAYDYYLKALRFQYVVSSASDLLTCIKLHEKAIELDPNFVLAHAMAAIAYMGVYQFFFDRDVKNLEKAASHLKFCNKVNPIPGEVHLANAFYYEWVQKDHDKSFNEFKKSIEIQPNNPEAHFWVGQHYVASLGNFDLGMKYLLKACSLDPLVIRYPSIIGDIYYAHRDFTKAEKYYKKVIDLSPGTYSSYVPLAETYIARKGDTRLARQVLNSIKDNSYLEDTYNIFIYMDILDRKFDKALKDLTSSEKPYMNYYFGYVPNSLMKGLVHKYKKEEEDAQAYFDSSRADLEKALAANPEDFRLHGALCITYAALGDKVKAFNEAGKAVELLHSHRPDKIIYARHLSRIYTLLGEYENAIAQIDVLFSNHERINVNLLKLDPFYDPLKNYPDYKELIEKYSQATE